MDAVPAADVTDPLLVLGVLAANIALSEWLVRRTWLSHLGTALLVILVTAVVANLGLIPTYSSDIPLYEGVFSHVALLGIFWLLLGVRLRELVAAGRAMIALFLLGALGTLVGVLVGMRVVDGEATLGEPYRAIGGMFVGTYTGGSVNFNAIALHYRVAENGALYAGANAVDSAMTTVWMAITLILPRWLRGRGLASSTPSAPRTAASPDRGRVEDTESVDPADLAWLLAMGAGALGLSRALEGLTDIPAVLLLTTIALVLAQFPVVQRLRGARLLGTLAVYLFLAVIGALCDLSALAELGSLGVTLLVFVVVAVLIHGVVVFGVAVLLRLDPDIAAVASQANIGGAGSALALARGLGRSDLVLPGILVGALGTALGTYLGFTAAEALL